MLELPTVENKAVRVWYGLQRHNILMAESVFSVSTHMWQQEFGWKARLTEIKCRKQARNWPEPWDQAWWATSQKQQVQETKSLEQAFWRKAPGAAGNKQVREALRWPKIMQAPKLAKPGFLQAGMVDAQLCLFPPRARLWILNARRKITVKETWR
jgi:hypothetical protein